MVAYFNELTLSQEAQQNLSLFDDFRPLWVAFAQKASKDVCRLLCHVSCCERLTEVVGLSTDRGLTEFICSFMNLNFQSSDDEFTEEIKDRFNLVEFSIRLKPTSSPECFALGWAYLNDTVALGLSYGFFRNQLRCCIKEYDLENDKQVSHEAYCITNRKQLSDPIIIRWFNSHQKHELPPRDLDEVWSRARGLKHVCFPDSAWTPAFGYKSFREYNVIWRMLLSLENVLWNLRFQKKTCNLEEEFSVNSEFELALSETAKTKEGKAIVKDRTLNYKGRKYLLWPHIKYNGKQIFRIYFAFDPDDEQIVVGYLGEHMTTFGSQYQD